MKNLYSVFDSVAQFYLPIFTADSDGIAKRIFIASMGDQFAHRSDYNLHKMGTFDDQTGEIHETSPALILAGQSISPDLDPRPRPTIAPEGNVQ